MRGGGAGDYFRAISPRRQHDSDFSRFSDGSGPGRLDDPPHELPHIEPSPEIGSYSLAYKNDLQALAGWQAAALSGSRIL